MVQQFGNEIWRKGTQTLEALWKHSGRQRGADFHQAVHDRDLEEYVSVMITNSSKECRSP